MTLKNLSSLTLLSFLINNISNRGGPSLSPAQGFSGLRLHVAAVSVEVTTFL